MFRRAFSSEFGIRSGRLEAQGRQIFTAWVSTSKQVNCGRFQLRRRVLQSLVVLTGHMDTTAKFEKIGVAHSHSDLFQKIRGSSAEKKRKKRAGDLKTASGTETAFLSRFRGSFSAFLCGIGVAKPEPSKKKNIPLCCSVLGASVSLMEDFLGVARCSSVFLGAARCSSVFLGLPRCCSVFLGVPRCCSVLLGVPRCSSVFLAVARCCSVLLALEVLGVARCCSVFLGVPRCCSVLLVLELFGVARYCGVYCGVFRSFLVPLGVSSVLLCGWEPP